MKIAYIIPNCSVSGGIAVICQHANRLLARGHEVLLVSETEGSVIDWFPRQKVPILRLADYPADIDILVATSWGTSFRVASLPARKKFYFVQSDETRFHTPGSVWQHMTALSYRFCFRYLTEARWIQTWLKDNFGHEARLIPNGLDLDLFHPCTPLAKKGKKPRILLEGAIGLPYKGMKEAFLAVEPLDLEVWCVSSYGRPDPGWKCDRFFEKIPMSQMREIYSSCDILVKLSRVEGFFGPPLEMMACGGVSVVGRVTGYDEYIENEINALVVDPQDVAAATVAIQRLIADPALYRRLQENGLHTARLWSWEPSIDKLEACFLDALEEENPSPPQPYSTNTDKSIAALYTILTGEESTQLQHQMEIVENTNVDKLCRRLKQYRWFRRIANVVAFFYYRWPSLSRRAREILGRI